MPLVFDSTPGGSAANSYASVSEASTYFDARRNADAWAGASNADRELALCAAAQRLEQLDFKGAREASTQRLKWPRSGVCVDGVDVAGTVPDVVKFAQCELALELLNAGTTDPLAETGLEAFAALSLGAIDLRVAPRVAGALSPQVARIVRPVLAAARGTRLVRG